MGVQPPPPPPPLWIRIFFFFLLVREVGDVRWVPLLCVWKIDPKMLRLKKSCVRHWSLYSQFDDMWMPEELHVLNFSPDLADDIQILDLLSVEDLYGDFMLGQLVLPHCNYNVEDINVNKTCRRCRPANLWESKTVFCDPKNCISPQKTVFYNKMRTAMQIKKKTSHTSELPTCH